MSTLMYMFFICQVKRALIRDYGRAFCVFCHILETIQTILSSAYNDYIMHSIYGSTWHLMLGQEKKAQPGFQELCFYTNLLESVTPNYRNITPGGV